ncbi:hypothetical protein ACM792_14660 [Metapseudomonas otitidis]|uniref:hypothetical protein n=1 Tax=Metapseudomonas otitidis TaxID=319939 RepID=UPI0039FCC405
MGFYDDMAAIALEMISEFGQAVTIQHTQPGHYDPITGGTGPGITREQVAQGLLMEYTGTELLANSMIKVGDKKLRVAAHGLEWPLSLSNRIIIGGRTWTVVPPLKEINPAGTPILYELQVRA